MEEYRGQARKILSLQMEELRDDDDNDDDDDDDDNKTAR